MCHFNIYTMNSNNFCVIMAGGAGTRFWPVSRNAFPKQFIDFLGTGKSLLQMTVQRFLPVVPMENIYIVTNETYSDLVREQLPELDAGHILLEPFRRNTAPCIAYANYKIKQRNPEANIIVAPSDHLIPDEQLFNEHIASALACAENNSWLLTLGIHPTRPETGYGYIQYDNTNRYMPDPRISKVRIFTEKPQLELAKQFLESGDFLWNAGIFVWKLPTIMKAFEQHLPAIDQLFQSVEQDLGTEREQASIRRIYEECTSISIDYGIMEKAENVSVLASNFAWSDLGTWTALYEQMKQPDQKNALVEPTNIFTYNTTNCIITASWLRASRMPVEPPGFPFPPLSPFIMVDISRSGVPAQANVKKSVPLLSLSQRTSNTNMPPLSALTGP